MVDELDLCIVCCCSNAHLLHTHIDPSHHISFRHMNCHLPPTDHQCLYLNTRPASHHTRESDASKTFTRIHPRPPCSPPIWCCATSPPPWPRRRRRCSERRRRPHRS